MNATFFWRSENSSDAVGQSVADLAFLGFRVVPEPGTCAVVVAAASRADPAPARCPLFRP